MLLDVGLQHRVEVLKLSVSNQTYDVYLSDGREKQKDSQGNMFSQRWKLYPII